MLGDDLTEKYIKVKTEEYMNYRNQVTDWEITKYLHVHLGTLSKNKNETTKGGVSMIGIIVVFPKKENAINIRNLLVRNGVNVTGVATTGHRQCLCGYCG